MSTRFQIAALLFMMTNAVAFGVGPILMIPAFANHAFEAIPPSCWQASWSARRCLGSSLRASEPDTGGRNPKRLFRVLVSAGS